MTTRRVIRAATRASPLARWQTDHVAALLATAAAVSVETVLIETLGDRTQALGTPLHQLGGQGVFVKEVQAAVLDGRADIAVHSAKDLPSEAAPGLAIVAVPQRGDPRDAMIGSTLDDLRDGAVVATGSVRRRAQLASIRPDLSFAELRGNIGTRLQKADRFDAIVLAAVPLHRLGVEDRIAELLTIEVMLPMVGQGALAVECRVDDHHMIELLAGIDHYESHAAVTAERAYLSHIGGGCDLPVGALAVWLPDGHLRLRALIASLDGRAIVRDSQVGTDPQELGERVAREVLAHGGERLLRGRVD